MNIVRSLHLLALAAIAVSSSAQTAASGATTPPDSESIAELIKVSAEIRQLQKLSTSTVPADRWQILWLHQHISEQVMAASLQVDATTAQIDNEIARANEVRGSCRPPRPGGEPGKSAQRDRWWSGGRDRLRAELSSNLTKPAAGVGIGAGTLSAGLALTGIHEQRGKTSPFDFDSNMLAEFFDRPTLPNSQYPATIWIFLNEASPYGPPGLTRKEQLLQTWVQVKRIDSLASKDKIDRLTSQPSEDLKLTIDDFEDRGAMLQDVRARISYLKRDLGTLLASLPAVTSQP